MEKINALVDWCGKNYAGYITDERINALNIVVTAKTRAELDKELREAVQFHIDGCVEDGDQLPEWAVAGTYEIVVEPRMSALLHEVLMYTTLAALSRATGIKHAQLSHYANAVSQPRPEQRERIIAGMHQIGHACLAIQ